MAIKPNESPRVAHLRKLVLETPRSVDIERAKIFYEYLYEEGGYDKDALNLAVAKAFYKYYDERTIYIDEGQLIVGTLGNKTNATPFYLECTGKDFLKEYDKLPSRKVDPFEYSKEDQQTINEIYAKYKSTSTRALIFQSLTEDERALFLKDPDHDFITSSYLFAMDALLSGPGGHVSPGYEDALNHGLEYIKGRAKHRLTQAEAEQDEKGISFLNALIVCIDAVCRFSDRYSAMARELAEQEADPQRRQELLKIAEVCAHVPRYPARDFHEAVQATWMMYMSVTMESQQRCFAVGRFDQFIYPFYKKDMESGKLTKEWAQEIIDCFFMRFAETHAVLSENYTETISGFPAQQQIVIGGQTKDGKDGCNELTFQCLQALANTRFQQPSLSVRLWRGSPEALYLAAAEAASLGTGHPSLFNDEVVIPALMDKGVAREDAYGYSIGGCTGAQPQGNDKGSHNGGYMNFSGVMEFVLRDGFWVYGNRQVGPHTGDARAFTCFDDFKKAFEGQMEYLIRLYCSSIKKAEVILRDYLPTPFLSALIDDCVTRARDRCEGGAWYNPPPTARAVGFADIVDSMATIKKHVFEDKDVTMDEIIAALDVNFEGYEDLRQTLMDAPHYGNDDDYADEIAAFLTEVYTREFSKYSGLYGGRFNPGFGSVSANLMYGEVIAALPNGRKAYTAFADGISPAHQMDAEGPTAVINSVSKLDHIGMSGGSICNMKFSPSSVQSEEGQHKLADFIKGAVHQGFFHLQFNVNDEKMLRDAQKNPESYKELLVRVAGYSAFFIYLSDRLQEDVIGRTCHTV